MIHDPQDWNDPHIFGEPAPRRRWPPVHPNTENEPLVPPSRWRKRLFWAVAILVCIAVWIGILYGLLWVVGDL